MRVLKSLQFSSNVTPSSLGVAKSPLEQIHLDYTRSFMGRIVLVHIGTYSKWLEIKIVLAATTRATISCLQMIICNPLNRNGIFHSEFTLSSHIEWNRHKNHTEF